MKWDYGGFQPQLMEKCNGFGFPFQNRHPDDLAWWRKIYSTSRTSYWGLKWITVSRNNKTRKAFIVHPSTHPFLTTRASCIRVWEIWWMTFNKTFLLNFIISLEYRLITTTARRLKYTHSHYWKRFNSTALWLWMRWLTRMQKSEWEIKKPTIFLATLIHKLIN